MNQEILNHLVENRARFDRQGKFIYLPIAKAMSGSIDILLGDRAIHRKMNSKIYDHLKPLFRPEEYEDAKRTHLSKDQSDVFIFTFVRNPWDRVVSALSYLRGHNLKGFKFSGDLRPEDFQKFIKQVLAKHGPSFYVDFREQEHYLMFQGQQLADFVGRYENFADDWKHVAQSIGLDIREAPKLRKSKHEHYSYYYDNETKYLVANIFSKDIELLGYSFEN